MSPIALGVVLLPYASGAGRGVPMSSLGGFLGTVGMIVAVAGVTHLVIGMLRNDHGDTGFKIAVTGLVILLAGFAVDVCHDFFNHLRLGVSSGAAWFLGIILSAVIIVTVIMLLDKPRSDP